MFRRSGLQWPAIDLNGTDASLHSMRPNNLHLNFSLGTKESYTGVRIAEFGCAHGDLQFQNQQNRIFHRMDFPRDGGYEAESGSNRFLLDCLLREDRDDSGLTNPSLYCKMRWSVIYLRSDLVVYYCLRFRSASSRLGTELRYPRCACDQSADRSAEPAGFVGAC